MEQCCTSIACACHQGFFGGAGRNQALQLHLQTGRKCSLCGTNRWSLNLLVFGGFEQKYSFLGTVHLLRGSEGEQAAPHCKALLRLDSRVKCRKGPWKHLCDSSGTLVAVWKVSCVIWCFLHLIAGDCARTGKTQVDSNCQNYSPWEGKHLYGGHCLAARLRPKPDTAYGDEGFSWICQTQP